ncbi:MAG: hypothetical protein NZ704_07575 [Geminicoccaceae bacterium]|nr:hypothetical protein [Geminicoccaceae bacterium]
MERCGRAGPNATLGSPAASFELLEHELRTPLTAIRAIAEILKEDSDLTAAEREALLDALLVEQARLARTLETLLDALARR